jgi:hypothetical protein
MRLTLPRPFGHLFLESCSELDVCYCYEVFCVKRASPLQPLSRPLEILS